MSAVNGSATRFPLIAIRPIVPFLLCVPLPTMLLYNNLAADFATRTGRESIVFAELSITPGAGADMEVAANKVASGRVCVTYSGPIQPLAVSVLRYRLANQQGEIAC